MLRRDGFGDRRGIAFDLWSNPRPVTFTDRTVAETVTKPFR